MTEACRLAEYSKVCEKAVRAAGAIIQDWIGRINVRHKGPADLVTEADFAAQEEIRAIVLGAFPDHSLLGEEGLPPQAERTEYRWLADPLDGTTNYVHGVPHYCVSLALEHKGTAIVGAVFDPSLDECFTAIAGRGALLNGQPIRTSDVSEMSQALAASGFPAKVESGCPEILAFNEAVFRCQGVRRTGSAALNLCYVAAGRFDVNWGFSTKIWDIAAGTLLVQEAGGVVTAPDGGRLVLDDPKFMAAANPSLYPQLRSLLEKARAAI